MSQRGVITQTAFDGFQGSSFRDVPFRHLLERVFLLSRRSKN
jgi:hypothetical protein